MTVKRQITACAKGGHRHESTSQTVPLQYSKGKWHAASTSSPSRASFHTSPSSSSRTVQYSSCKTSKPQLHQGPLPSTVVAGPSFVSCPVTRSRPTDSQHTWQPSQSFRRGPDSSERRQPARYDSPQAAQLDGQGQTRVRPGYWDRTYGISYQIMPLVFSWQVPKPGHAPGPPR